MTQTELELYKKLELAQSLLSDVYHYACENGMQHLESVTSAADSCILEAMDYIKDIE
jgi:hypothetical protein